MITNIRSIFSITAVLLVLPATLPAQDNEDSDKNPVVVMKTSEGEIQLELFRDAAPKTVKNFIDLAEGRKEFTDPKTGEKVKRPYFDGLTFHRVIPNFMIQGGDPLGTGTGGPGYTFEDEINGKALGLDEIKAVEGGKPNPWLLIRSQQDFQRQVLAPLFHKMGITSQEELEKQQEEVQKAVEALTLYDVYTNMGYQYNDDLESRKPVRGVIAMANSGPNTNGSQFFITVVDTPHLTGKHTVFGKVIKGMDVVDKISQVETDSSAKPLEPVTIESVRTLKEEEK